MKFEDLIVGMQVKAVDDFYDMAAKKCKWVGTVYKICDDGTFIAKTENSIYTADKNRIYECLHPEHFEEAEPEYDFDKNKLEEQEKKREEAKEKAKKAKEELKKVEEDTFRFLEKLRKEDEKEMEVFRKKYYFVEEEMVKQCRVVVLIYLAIALFALLIGLPFITCA